MNKTTKPKKLVLFARGQYRGIRVYGGAVIPIRKECVFPVAKEINAAADAWLAECLSTLTSGDPSKWLVAINDADLAKVNAGIEARFTERCAACPHRKLAKKYGLIDKLFGKRTKQTEEERRAKTEQYFHGLTETQDRLLNSLNDKERAIIEQRFGIKPKRGVQLKGAGESKFCCPRCGTAFDYADDYLNHRQVCAPRKSTKKAKP